MICIFIQMDHINIRKKNTPRCQEYKHNSMNQIQERGTIIISNYVTHRYVLSTHTLTIACKVFGS